MLDPVITTLVPPLLSSNSTVGLANIKIYRFDGISAVSIRKSTFNNIRIYNIILLYHQFDCLTDKLSQELVAFNDSRHIDHNFVPRIKNRNVFKRKLYKINKNSLD